MSKRLVAASAAMAVLLTAVWPAAARAELSAGAGPPVEAPAAEAFTLTLEQALSLAERNNPGLQLALYQLQSARSALTTAPAQAASLAPAAALYARVQFGVTIPETAISPAVAARQSQISYEQAVVQYYTARQQVRLGALQSYVEWQKAVALVHAQQSALERAHTQLSQVQASYDAGVVARFDLLQAEAQVAGQEAGLAGALAMRGAALGALEQVIGQPLVEALVPADLAAAADTTVLPGSVVALMTKALQNRPDLREARLTLAERRLQVSLAAGPTAATAVQLQAAAAQYEMQAARARAEVRQAFLAATSALEELKARELAQGPSVEALRLAELRYEAGLATYLEVQSALAAALQAEASRIQAAANLTLQLAKLSQATGDL